MFTLYYYYYYYYYDYDDDNCIIIFDFLSDLHNYDIIKDGIVTDPTLLAASVMVIVTSEYMS